MRFTVSKNLLSTNIQMISKVIPARTTMPILSSILFELKGNNLALRSTDIELTINTEIKVNGFEDGSVAIPGRIISNLVNEIEEEKMDFQSDEKGPDKIGINAGRGKFEIMGRPGDEFPSIPEIGTTTSIKIDNKILSKMVQKSVFAVSKDEMRPALTGVLFQMFKNEMRAVATDGHRLVYLKRFQKESLSGKDFSTTDFPKGTPLEEDSVIIPAKFLSLILGYIEEDGTTTLNIGKNHVNVSIGSTSIYSRKIDQKFPDYEMVIPSDNDKVILADVSELLSVLRRISIFTNKTTHQIVLNLRKGVLKVNAIDEESLLSGDEEMNIEYEGEDLRIGFNVEYLKEILRNIDTQKAVIKFKSPVDGGLFLPEQQEENEDFTMLLMPIRLSE